MLNSSLMLCNKLILKWLISCRIVISVLHDASQSFVRKDLAPYSIVQMRIIDMIIDVYYMSPLINLIPAYYDLLHSQYNPNNMLQYKWLFFVSCMHCTRI